MILKKASCSQSHVMTCCPTIIFLLELKIFNIFIYLIKIKKLKDYGLVPGLDFTRKISLSFCSNCFS